MAVLSSALLVYLISFCHGLVSSNCSLMTTTFQNFKNIELACGISPVELNSNFEDYLACSRACIGRHDCNSFEFTPFNLSNTSSGHNLGTCTYCPIYNITGLNYAPTDPQVETWLGILGIFKLDLPANTFLPITGALSSGRLLVIKGRIPVPKPDRVIIDIFNNDKDEIPIRVSPRFDFRDVVNTVMVSYRLSKIWSVQPVSQSKFPFEEGKDFEINVLSTQQGFKVYAGEIFLRDIGPSKYLSDDIGYLRFENVNVYGVSF